MATQRNVTCNRRPIPGLLTGMPGGSAVPSGPGARLLFAVTCPALPAAATACPCVAQSGPSPSSSSVRGGRTWRSALPRRRWITERFGSLGLMTMVEPQLKSNCSPLWCTVPERSTSAMRSNTMRPSGTTCPAQRTDSTLGWEADAIPLGRVAPGATKRNRGAFAGALPNMPRARTWRVSNAGLPGRRPRQARLRVRCPWSRNRAGLPHG